MNWLNSFFSNQIVIVICSIIAGVFIEKIRRKTKKIEYYSVQNRLGLSLADPIFGDIKILHNGNQVRNLWNITLNIFNNTHQDFKAMDIKVYTGPGTEILSEKTQILETSYIIDHTEEYHNFMHVEENNQPTQHQITRFYTTKDYHIPVFNRFQTISINLLCTRPNDEQIPYVFIDTLTPGLKLKQVQHFVFTNGTVFNVPIRKTLPYGLIFSAILIFLLTFLTKESYGVSYLSWFLGLIGTLLGAILYKLIDKIRRLLFG